MKTIILGPPGTGKTTTLLNLVDEFIQDGVRPKQIGYFSFTKKAATEAATRAADKFGLDIENDLAFFKFDKFFDKLKSKNWKHSEDKTGRMMQVIYKDCEIQFLEQKRFPSKESGKYNSSTKNVVQINIKSFEEVPIHHTKLVHKTEIM